MGKVIHWELCKKLKFDNTNKWYMHNLASILENETQKIIWDFRDKNRIPTIKPERAEINIKK